MNRKLASFWVLSISLMCLLSASAHASDSTTTSSTDTPGRFSAADFDWRDLVPYLLAATRLPDEQGITAVLENSLVLRTYVAREVRQDCRSHARACNLNSEHSNLEDEVSKRIAQIVQEGIFHRHKNAIVDYKLTRQPFPFSEIAAVKGEKKSDVYLLLELADRSYKAADVQDKYGAPFDTNIFQWYSVFKYRMKTADYTSDAVFEIDPVDGAVIKMAVNLKTRKHH